MFKITWDQVIEGAKELAKQYQGKKIWGVPRGGIIVAAIMAHHGCELAPVAAVADVIVDDIADTGRTLAAVVLTTRQECGVLFKRSGCNYIPDYTVNIMYDKGYVLFPWENEEEAKRIEASGSFRSGDYEKSK